MAFGVGWLFSRLDILHWRIESRHSPKAYFKGLNHLLNGQQDRAVDSFIEAVQNDPDTLELHFTLGNLFRRRGEFDRAVRVHEHLLARSDLNEADRARARLALAQDFWRAGLLDRAEAALIGLDSLEAQQLMLSICERGRDWIGAKRAAQKLQAMGAGSYIKREAHYLCEQKLYQEAISLSPESPRAYLELAKQVPSERAYALMIAAIERAPQAAPILADAFIHAAQTEFNLKNAVATLAHIYDETQSLDVLQALIRAGWRSETEGYAQHLAHTPSLVAVSHLIHAPEAKIALLNATEPLMRYRCASCGFEAKQYFWQCPGCQAWDSYPFKRVEEL